MNEPVRKHRKKSELPFPELSRNDERNRTKKQMKLRLKDELILAIHHDAAAHNQTIADWMTDAVVDKLSLSAIQSISKPKPTL